MRETWDRSLGWEDPLEKGTAAHFSILYQDLAGEQEDERDREHIAEHPP